MFVSGRPSDLWSTIVPMGQIRSNGFSRVEEKEGQIAGPLDLDPLL